MRTVTPADLSGVRSVVFDLDGTLVDSVTDVAVAYCRALRVRGFEPPDLEQVRIGPSLEAMIRHDVGEDADPAVVDAVANEFRRLYDADDYGRTTLFPGALELLTRWRRSGVRLSIATNKRSVATRRLLEIKGIADFFDEVLCIDRDGEKWSKTRMLDHIMAATGVGPEETVFIGDSAGDVRAGRETGVTTVGVLYGYEPPEDVQAAGPDYVCNDLREFLA